MTLRHWSKQTADAKSIIERVVKGIDATVAVDVVGEDLRDDTAQVVLRKGGRTAFVIVTFEAWTNAKTASEEMAQAFRQVISDLTSPEGPKSSFLVTSAGLVRKPLKANKQRLQDAAAAIEGEQVAKRFFEGRNRG